MKKMAMLTALAAMSAWCPPNASYSMGFAGYSYPASSNRHTGKAAERRAAKRRRKAK